MSEKSSYYISTAGYPEAVRVNKELRDAGYEANITQNGVSLWITDEQAERVREWAKDKGFTLSVGTAHESKPGRSAGV